MSDLNPHEQMAWGLAIVLSMAAGVVGATIVSIALGAALGHLFQWIAGGAFAFVVVWLVLHYAPFVRFNPAHRVASWIWHRLDHDKFMVR